MGKQAYNFLTDPDVERTAEMEQSLRRYNARMLFDLNGLQPDLNQGILELSVERATIEGPVFTEQMLMLFRDAGIAEVEIEGMVEDMLRTVTIRQLANLLAQRQRG